MNKAYSHNDHHWGITIKIKRRYHVKHLYYRSDRTCLWFFYSLICILHYHLNMFRALQRSSSGGLNCIMHHLVCHSLLAAIQHTCCGDNVIYILQNKELGASSWSQKLIYVMMHGQINITKTTNEGLFYQWYAIDNKLHVSAFRWPSSAL
jgi:hypothetical protein